MPSKWKTLSGEDIVKILQMFGFEIISQKGSHIKMRRINSAGSKETLVIPNHKTVSLGTLVSINNQTSNYIAGEMLDIHFKNF